MRIEAFEHQRAVDDREHNEGDGGDRGDEDERCVVEREHGAEQHMQEVDIAAAHRDDQNAERERDEIEGGEARILAQDRRARDEASGERHGKPRQEAAKAHGEQRQAGEEIADGSTGKDGMAHGVAHQAHAPKHEEDADRGSAERQSEQAD